VTIASLTIGGVLLAAMICIAVYGWVALPAGARVPVHHGRRYNTYTSKTVGLVMWPVGGAVIYVILIVLSKHAAGTSGQQNGSDVPLILIPLMLLILTFVEYGAISVARKNTRSARRNFRSPRRNTRSARR
jgi:hypothetical protein